MKERFSRLRTQLRYDGLFWRRFMYLGCVYGPEWWKRYSPPAFAAAIFLLVGRNRRISMQNLARVLGTEDRRQVARATIGMWAEFAHCLTETVELFGPRPTPLRIDVPEHDLIAEALGEGRGAILLTGHFGNWDIAAQGLGERVAPIHVVMARESNTTSRDYVRAAREQAGLKIVYSDTSVFAALPMLQALRRNEIVAVQLDRPIGSDLRRLPFFGVPAPFPAGPFTLARLSGAPIISVFVPRLGRQHYAIRFGSKIRLSRENHDAQIEAAMRTAVGELESMIREHPRQWFQFAPFWEHAEPTAPKFSADAPLDATSERRR